MCILDFLETEETLLLFIMPVNGMNYEIFKGEDFTKNIFHQH